MFVGIYFMVNTGYVRHMLLGTCVYLEVTNPVARLLFEDASTSVLSMSDEEVATYVPV